MRSRRQDIPRTKNSPAPKGRLRRPPMRRQMLHHNRSVLSGIASRGWYAVNAAAIVKIPILPIADMGVRHRVEAQVFARDDKLQFWVAAEGDQTLAGKDSCPL